MGKRNGVHVRSTVLVLLLLLGAFFVVVPGATVALQDGDYSYTVDGGVATITGYTGAGGAITIPSTLGGYSVVAIGSFAFYNCTSLTSVTIGSGVTSIGTYVFFYCTSLTSVTIGNGVTSIGDGAFAECTSLTSVTIGNGVTSIGDYAFDYCISLTSMTIPNSVTNIGDFAFALCTSLTSVTIGNGVTSIGDYAFDHCISLTSMTIPANVVSIGNDSFYSCSSLTSVTIGNGVTSIGDSAFADCISLTSVTIPANVVFIGNYSFYSCSSLTAIDVDASNANYASIDGVLYNKAVTTLIQCPSGKAGAFTIPNSVTTVEDSAFAYCNSMSSVTIPDSVTFIGPGAFKFCAFLTAIDVDASNANYASIDGVLYNKAITTLIQYPSMKAGAFTIPNSVTTIGDYAFEGCTSLTSITIPNSVTNIGHNAFYYCTSLTSVTIPDSVTSIGYSAFAYCTSLTSMTIPNSVTNIGDWTFYDCISIASIAIGSGVTFIGDKAFANCASLTSITFLGLVAPATVDANWIQGTDPGIRGHAYATSNFPAPGGVWNGLMMGAVIAEDYVYTISSGVATITEYIGGGGAITIPSTLGGCSVVAIGTYAFEWCDSLTSVTIPNSVTSIGDRAFAHCTSLTSVTIGSGVTNIGYDAFAYCTSLTSVTIPDSVTFIGGFAFGYCTSLTAIDVDASNPNYASIDGVLYNKAETALIQCPGGKAGTVSIPNSVTTIEGYAFAHCASLTSVTIPDSVTTIGNSAFYDCSSLASATIGSGVTSIGIDAFRECISLISVVIPDSVTSIGERAFWNCFALSSVNIGSGVTTIGSLTFHACYSLTSVTMEDGLVSIGEEAFWSCTSLTSVSIPNTVASIGNDAFEYTALTSVIIPNSVTSVGDYSYQFCTSLTSVTMGGGVTSIGDYAFANCTSLTSITFNGLVAPTAVGTGWILNTDAGIRGHAFAASNFPVPGGVFHGLTMGAVIAVTPGAPSGLSATPGNTQVVLSWTTPTGDGGSSIDYYVVYRDGVDVSHPMPTTATITGLTNGQAYSFTVAAHNIAGLGAQTGVVSSTPFTVPNSPTGLTVTPGNAQVTLSWTAPVLNGGRVIDYYVIYLDGNALPTHPTGVTTVITGLNNGQSYSFKVAAHNLAGIGAQSIVISSTPRTVPNAPTGLTATPSNAQPTLTWTAPASDGGSSITGYKVYRSTNETGTYSLIASPTALTYTDTGLTNGQTYWYKVSAVNAAGEGAQSPAVSALVPQPVSPASDNTMLILLAVIAIAVVLVVVLFVLRWRKGKRAAAPPPYPPMQGSATGPTGNIQGQVPQGNQPQPPPMQSQGYKSQPPGQPIQRCPGCGSPTTGFQFCGTCGKQLK